MSNEWAHDAARKGVPTEMKNLIHDGRLMTDPGGRDLAGSTGAHRRGGVAVQLVQDRSGIARARVTACAKPVVTLPQTTLQKNPFMTREAVVNGASSGPHRAWDPV
jgi:hypothetical protein